MTVADLIQLLEYLPRDRKVVVQDEDGDATLSITGAWLPPAVEGLPDEPIQLTTRDA